MVESDRSNICMFHLRRVQFQTFAKEKGCQINDGIEPNIDPTILSRSTMILLDKQTKIGRNPELVDVVLHSVVHSNMISRDHSEIVGVTDDKGKYIRYLITDRSLNGTYVNDTRVNIQQQLKEGDLIKFGHVNGAAIKAGEYAPQQSAEFIFRFERALSNYNYFGYNKKRVRIQSEHRRAYMQINSDLILPTEVYSCVAVPKALPPSSGTLSGPSGSSINIPAGSTTTNVLPVAPDSTTNHTGAPVVVIPQLSTPSISSSSATTIPVTCNVGHSNTNGFIGNNSNNTTTTMPNNTSQQIHCQNNNTLNNYQHQQLAHLAALAATTAVTNAQQQNSSSSSIGSINNSQQQQQRNNNNNIQQVTTNNNHQQQQQQLNNALNQLGLGTAGTTTDEQVAVMNAQLRSIMASHDAMSAMERLAAQQQWQKSLLNLNSLHQQNPIIYGQVFPAAAAAAAALFSGIGGIDLNAAAASNPTAAQYAASLWPNIRASLQQQPTTAQEWTQQQQQKAATLAHQLQLRLPVSLYQPQAQQQSQQQQHQLSATGGQQQQQARAASASSAVTVASSLFGTPSAFSLPSSHQQQTATSVPPHSTNNLQSNNNIAASAAAAAGLLVTAQPSQNQALSHLSNASAAYSSCTSNTANHPSSMLNFRQQQQGGGGSNVTPLSRGASSSSLTPPTTTSSSNTTQLNVEHVAVAKGVTTSTNGWPNINDGFINSSSSKVSPILAAAALQAANSRLPNVTTSTQNDLQRIPEIASALAAAIAAQQQQQANNNNDSSNTINIPISIANTSSARGTPSLQQQTHSSSISQTIQHSLAQRLLSSTTTPISSSSNLNNSSISLNNSNNNNIDIKRCTNSGNSNFSSSSGISSATSSSLLQSPSAIPATKNNHYETMASTSSKMDTLASPSLSLNSSGASSAFSTPAQQQQQQNINNNSNGNITNLSTLTAALFAAEKVNNNTNTKRPPIEDSLLNRRQSTSRTCEEKNQSENDSNLPIALLDNSTTSAAIIISPSSPQSEQNQKQHLKINNSTTIVDESKMTRLMECDSSVPSPPSKRDDDDEEEEDCLNKNERREELLLKKNDDNENEHMDIEANDTFRKRHSDSITSIKSNDETKPPVKHARKSNEVARLLNDLTAGNCSWQYMAERQQKMKGVKASKDNGDSKKKAMRLGDRQQAKIERNKAHTMLRQISDSEGSGSEESKEQQYKESAGDFVMASDDNDSFDEGTTESLKRTSSDVTKEKKKKVIRRSSNSISDLSFNTFMIMNDSQRKKMIDTSGSGEKPGNKVKTFDEKTINKLVIKSSDEDDDNSSKEEDVVVKAPPQPRKVPPIPTKRTPAALSTMPAKLVKNKNATSTTATTSTKTVGKKTATAAADKKPKTTAKNNKEKTKTIRGGGGKMKKEENNDEEHSNDEVDTKVETKKKEIGLVAYSDDSDVEEQKVDVDEHKTISEKTEKKATSVAAVADKKEKKKAVTKPRARSKQASEPAKEKKKERKATDKTTNKTTTKKSKKKKESTSDDSDDNVNIHDTTFDDEAEESTVMEDWTDGKGDPELCSHSNCKRPKDMNIIWVACDTCDQWFHTFCVLGKNIQVEDDKWYCKDCE